MSSAAATFRRVLGACGESLLAPRTQAKAPAPPLSAGKLQHLVGQAFSLPDFCHRLMLCLLILCASGCMVGPKYTKPSAPMPPAYKEHAPEAFKENVPTSPGEWAQAHPADGAVLGKWWRIYRDPALNALEEQVEISNQNVLAAEAQFREARAVVRVARSALFPTLTTSPSITFSRGGNGQVSASGQVTAGGEITTFYTLPFDVSYQADVWGSIRHTVRADENTAQATAAQLENARLSFQAALAEDYFEMHGIDAQTRLLTTTMQSYQEYLALTKYRYQSGIASDGDVALAQTQLETTRAQLIGLGVQRHQFEHAIAILVGKPPAEFSLPEVPLTATPPSIPVGLPSQLLERRPDIATAERQMAAANEQIGIAKAAYYPTVTLNGALGFANSTFPHWISWPSRFWSVGPQLAETLIDGGKRHALVAEMQAAYDNTVANYRQTVLTAFQQVEDNLAALRIYGEQAAAEDQAVAAARRSLEVTTAQYESGTTDYLSVITTQATLLADQVTAVMIVTNRMTASVLLIEALGGGWEALELPGPHSLISKSP